MKNKIARTVFIENMQYRAEELKKLTEQRAEELILAHEFYHFLEETKIGKTSERYKLPILSLGPIKIGSTGVRSLCEIGAYGFAKTYWDRFLAG